jgi:hypothetical protein
MAADLPVSAKASGSTSLPVTIGTCPGDCPGAPSVVLFDVAGVEEVSSTTAVEDTGFARDFATLSRF